MPDYVKTALRLARGLGKLHPEGAAGFTPAKGAPEVIKLPGIGRVQARPIEPIQETARSYMTQRGMTPKSPEFVPINPDYSKRVAGAYEAMQHDPRDPAVRRAYEALADETMDQFKAAQPLGIKYEFVKPGQKDQLPALGYSDLLNKGKLSVYPTSEGFGTNAGFEDSPLLKPVGKIGDNPNAVVNDAFRIVHDLYGHYGPGNAHFRAPGEERAFQLHSQMYSPEALSAAASETRGQNSWVNYGPHGEFNRTAPADQTIFADQKTGIMPAWAYELPPAEGEDVDAYIKSLGGKAKGGQVLSEEHTVPSKTNFIDPETGAIGQTTTEQTSKVSIGRGKLKSGGGAWTRAEGKNPNGGLNEKGRASLRAQGHDIKRPQPEGGSRRDSFCARMKGMKAKLTSKETANDPDSRINKSLRAWKCADGGAVWDKPRPEHLGKPHHLSSEQKSKAKAAAKAAGRPYPNLVDNMRAAKADGGRVELGAGGDALKAAMRMLSRAEGPLAKAAQGLGSSTTREGYQDLVNTFKPVRPYAEVPTPATTEAMINALHANKRGKVGLGSGLTEGQPVGLRLDIPAYTEHNVWVPTIHDTANNNKVLAHEAAARVTNPVFSMPENKALAVAQGGAKSPFATINGGWKPSTPEEAHALAQEALNHPDWRQVGMDPERHSYFYDRHTQEPITHAEEAVQVGPLVLAKKPVYGDVENYPYRNGGDVRPHLGAGGDAIKKAMGIIRAYHGSPHKFDKFDISKIGTGEGAQAYGHGLYFAGNENVAKQYRDKLSQGTMAINGSSFNPYKDLTSTNIANAINTNGLQGGIETARKLLDNYHPNDPRYKGIADDLNKLLFAQRGVVGPNKGSMYEVKLHTNPEHLLDWDKPLRDQSSYVQKALTPKNLGLTEGGPSGPWNGRIGWADETGLPLGPVTTGASRPSQVFHDNDVAATVYRQIGRDNPALSSARLNAAGIPGIKYLDAGSRGAGEGLSNYVMFSHDPVEILRRYKQGGHVEKAMRLIDRMHKDQGGGTDPSQFIHEQLFSGEPQLPQVNRDVEGLTEDIGNAAMQLGKTAAYLHPVTRGAMGVYDLAHGAMTGNPAEMATAVAGAPSKMARAIGAGAFAEDARGGKYARGGYATDGSVDGDVSYAPDDSQSFENSGSMMVQGYGEDQPQKTAHDFVQQQLNTGEPQLPQMDREAYDAWKYGVPMAAAHMAAYEIPYVGQTLAGYDAANAMKELASPEVREQLANKNYIAALPALADAGLSAMGLKGSKALVGAGALGTGLLASNEAQARSPQSEFLTRLAHAYRSHYDPAARIAGMPTTFKKGKEVAKNWLSGNKLSRPIEEMELQSQGHRPMVAESFSRPEDYAGKALITGLGDRTPAGYELTHINDRQLFRPVNFMGGYGFGRDIASQGRDRAIWGSGLSRARAIANRGKAAADAGYEPIFTYVAQAPESADYSHHMQDILLGQLDPARMDPKKAEFVDKRMREATTGSGSVFEPKPNWVGIQSPYMAQRLAERGDERVKLTKLLDAAQFRDDPAFADIGAARFASTDPNLMYDPSFSAGKAFFTMNPKGEVVKDPLHPHPSYNTQISAAPGRHGYLGRLEYELPPEIHYQNYLENEIKPELRGKPFARQTMSLLKQTPTVIATPEWVDKASQWQDIMRGLYGSRRKHGGKVKGALRLAQKLASKG